MSSPSVQREISQPPAALGGVLPLWLWPLLVLLVILPAGGLALRGSFDGLYSQDSFAYYNYATGRLREAILAGQAIPRFQWPPGYPLLVALATLVVGVTPQVGQWVSLVAGGLVPVFTALLADEVRLRADVDMGQVVGRLLVPIVAGGAVALNGQLWQSGTLIMSDATGLAAVTLGVWALARYGRRVTEGASPPFRWLALSAAALAYAVLTRWAFALVVFPCAAYIVVLLVRHRRPMIFLHAVAGGVIALLVLAPVAAPALRALAGNQAEGPSFVVSLEAATWNPLNAFRNSVVTSEGLLQYRLPTGLYYALVPARPFYFTPLLALFLLPGLWAVARNRALAVAFLIVGWALVVYLFLAGIWQNFRFTLTYLPPLAILLALGVEEVYRFIGRRLAPFLAVGLVLSFGWLAWSSAGLMQELVVRKATDLATVRWVEGQAPPDAQLLTFNLTLHFRQYTSLETTDLYFLDSPQLTTITAANRPVYLLLDVANVESQWRGQAPAESYHWLRDGPGLVELGQQGQYTLFRVGIESP